MRKITLAAWTVAIAVAFFFATSADADLVLLKITAPDHCPEGMEIASLPGPAFDAWPGTDEAEQQRLAQALVDWRGSLPPSPGADDEVSEERRRLLQEHGYWGHQ